MRADGHHGGRDGRRSTTATLNGAANPNGAAATGWFRYARTNPGTCNDTFGTRAPASSFNDTVLGSGNTSVAYSQVISGLAAGTTYFYCAIASSAEGTAFGAVQSFIAQLPPAGIAPILYLLLD